MKTGKAIKLSLFVGSLCYSLYQIPKMMEMVDGMGGGGGLSGLSGLSGLQGADNAFSMLEKLNGGMADPGASPEDVGGQLRVFSPNGEALTEAQRAELEAAAERLRPKIVRVGDEANEAAQRNGVTPSGVTPSNGSSLISNLDPNLLDQLKQVEQAENLLKTLTEVKPRK